MLYVIELHTGSTIKMESPSRLMKGLTRLCEVAGDSLRVVTHLPAAEKIVERVPRKASDFHSVDEFMGAFGALVLWKQFLIDEHSDLDPAAIRRVLLCYPEDGIEVSNEEGDRIRLTGEDAAPMIDIVRKYGVEVMTPEALADAIEAEKVAS